MQLLTAEQTAKLLNIVLSRLYDLVRKNSIPPGVVVRFGKRQIRFNETKLMEWIEQGGNIKCEKEEN